MNRMLKRRKRLAAVAACLVLGLGAAGVAGSTGEPTNEDLARQGALERPVGRSGAEAPTNEETLAEQGLVRPRAAASSPGGPSNDR